MTEADYIMFSFESMRDNNSSCLTEHNKIIQENYSVSSLTVKEFFFLLYVHFQKLMEILVPFLIDISDISLSFSVSVIQLYSRKIFK